MGKRRTSGSDNGQQMFILSEEAIEAVARSLYGEDEYDAMSDDHQVKDAYRKRAWALLKLAADANQNTRDGQLEE